MLGSVSHEDEQLPSNYPVYTSGCAGRFWSHNSRQPSHGHGSNAVPKEDSPSASPEANLTPLKTQTVNEAIQDSYRPSTLDEVSAPSAVDRNASSNRPKKPRLRSQQLHTSVIHRSAQQKDIQEPVIHPAKSVSPLCRWLPLTSSTALFYLQQLLDNIGICLASCTHVDRRGGGKECRRLCGLLVHFRLV
ncbi:hypothetical protein HDV57DRAFT_53465 [Trichoderma longibrachiatum]|uniref:Uncharacterized protein n=1 Tax=Trichoderma longibrachiatum ATCC 18648 TaxID=983965 RepID=A0A2T4C0P9_TRILO|nr:hypothetical protein M440DRAFT_336903 [Trichoderma longibrachiatum ATCC 18648]